MTTVIATLTEIRADHMQKWERDDLPTTNHLRYIWIAPFQSIEGVKVGSRCTLAFENGTGGRAGGHWSLWKVQGFC